MSDGHRERGDCADIETPVAVGPGTRDAIRPAADGIDQRGKTPITDAAVAAAESLRFTEERATVILVPDGVETSDPCTAARALQTAGIDFTAHVVGFDVTDAEALAQMRCLAEETGGTFTTAADAGELGDALRRVTAPPEPVVIAVAFEAVFDDDAPMDGPTDGPVDGPVARPNGPGARYDAIRVTPARAAPAATDVRLRADGGASSGRIALLSAPGDYVLRYVARAHGGILAERPIALRPSAAAPTGPDPVVAGMPIAVAWTGAPAAAYDWIEIARPGDAPGAGARLAVRAMDGSGTPDTPDGPGPYVIRYVSCADGGVLVERPVTLRAN